MVLVGDLWEVLGSLERFESSGLERNCAIVLWCGPLCTGWGPLVGLLKGAMF